MAEDIRQQSGRLTTSRKENCHLKREKVSIQTYYKEKRRGCRKEQIVKV